MRLLRALLLLSPAELLCKRALLSPALLCAVEEAEAAGHCNGHHACMHACLPGREDGAVQVSREQLQEGQPECHVASIFLKEEDGGPLAPRGLAPAHGMQIPSMELGAVLGCQIHILYQDICYATLCPSLSGVPQ